MSCAAILAAGLMLAGGMSAQTWTDPSLPAGQRAEALVSAMTLEEKISLVQGTAGPYVGNVAANARLGIPALGLSDGPAGIGNGAFGVTALPAPIAVAASWDTELARRYGEVLGTEARGKGIGVLLAPMMNLARVYHSGRNFEGSGEDPFLAGAIAAAQIQGIQSQGVIATAKHFVGNEQETDRTLASSEVDERTLQEVYYLPFRASVRAGAGAIMAAYNRVNTRYACELEALNATVKKQWGFEGFVMSDWYASFTTAGGADHGLDLEMPGNAQFGTALLNAVQAGMIPESEVEGMARRILTSMFQFGLFDNPSTGGPSAYVSSAEHEQFARQAAAQGMVLLKNEGGALPLSRSIRSIAVLGSVASLSPISTGCGSAGVSLAYNITPLDGITSLAGPGITVAYAEGDAGDVSEAVQLASASEVAIVCVGQRTCEGSDRSSLSLPGGQVALINAVAAANPRTVVVLYASASTLMPWAGQVPGILAAWYPGQENGHALAGVLFGDVNPAGKLPMTFPASTNQMPAATLAQFPGTKGHVSYSEGLFIGYRWYDASNSAPLFPFGHGLSYTTFVYSNLSLSAVSASGQVDIGFDVANTGQRAGAEVAQLYLRFPPAAQEPLRLLKGFTKVFLEPGSARRATLRLNWEDLACWNAATGWRVTPGMYECVIGASSRDWRLNGSFTVASAIPASDLANAALHRASTGSSTLAGSPASAAVDGNPASGWTSAGGGQQWLAVDLEKTKDLSRARLQWNTNYARAYALQLSPDGTNWSTVYSTAQGAGGTEEVLVSARGRHLRVYCTQLAAGAEDYSLRELEAYARPRQPLGASAHSLPGRVEAEDYDLGGQGVAYGTSNTTNPGGVYRADDVGLGAAGDVGGGYHVGWIHAGDWLEYTVKAPDADAVYRISARVASGTPGQMRVRLDGALLGTFEIPDTGGAQSWQTLSLAGVPLAGGTAKALRLEMLTGGFNLNWLQFDRLQICGVQDVAAGRPAVASSVENASYGAANAFDGNLKTRWSSGFSDPQWVRVDLGTTQDIARVRLNFEAAYSSSYQLQLSTDDSTWLDAYTTDNGRGGLNDLAVLGSARYVRFNGTQRRTPYGHSLYQFEVYPAQMPTLAATVLHTNTILNWPGSVAAWTLESTASLAPSARWEAVTNGVASVNSRNYVTNSTVDPVRFYRLRR